MTDSLDAKNALHTTLLARTRGGRIFKRVIFWIAIMGMFIVPLGILVLYFLWQHGDAIEKSSPDHPHISSTVESTVQS